MNFNWQKFDIDISKVRGGKSLCPHCSHTRKHKNDLCLSVDIESGLFNCHNCDFKGRAVDFKPTKEYLKPAPRLEKVSKEIISFFEKRGISNNTLLRFKITEAKQRICFNYFRNEELVNIKFRSLQKEFLLSKHAELIFYNLDAIQGENSAVIVEGEIDCLTLHECGIYNSVSVPNGATKGQKLEYLDNCWEYFENMEKIVLAVDGDEAGNALRDELARRLGKEKCFTIEYPKDCKDANEVLLKEGKQAIVQIIENAKQWPLEGIITMDEIFPVISEWYTHGYPKGTKARIPGGFDELLSFALGELTVITGIPGHGKDEFTNWIMANLAKHENWSWGVCGFEETPYVTTSKLIEKFAGKAFDFRVNLTHRIDTQDYEYGVGMVDKYFKFVHTEKSETDLESILNLAESVVKRYGIKGFCLSPWNWIDHLRKEYMTETEYVSQCLTKIVRFAKKFNVAFFLIAHTTKMQKDKVTGKHEVPTLYSISGSAHFFNKTHNGITIYRDYKTNVVDVYVQKVKQSWQGKLGFCSFNYNTLTRQYEAINL